MAVNDHVISIFTSEDMENILRRIFSVSCLLCSKQYYCSMLHFPMALSTAPFITVDEIIFQMIFQMRQGVLDRNGPTQLVITSKLCKNLIILVENQGRINAGSKMTDPKGIIQNATLDETILTNWEVAPFLPMTFSESNKIVVFDDDEPQGLYIGRIPVLEKPQDSYLLLKGWSKVCISFLQ